MEHELFHADNANQVDVTGLRKKTIEVVSTSSLIRRAQQGEYPAAAALKVGFWPFVSGFEHAIDQQPLPRHPLVSKFGEQRVRRVFLGIARAVRDMKREEGSHAAHWRKDAQCLGVWDLSGPCVPSLRSLIECSYTKNLPAFFATLAGTEFIAEELSRVLANSRRFTSLFTRKRWMWGEVHLAPHEHGPSHLEIDLDLARAYSTNTDAIEIEQMVLDTITLFGRTADQVERVLLPELMVA
jgi:hypothetical protein